MKPIWANTVEKLSFGGMQFALCIYMAFASYYLMVFFTDVSLIPLTVTASLLLGHRLFSVVCGQGIGLFINRRRFKEGKYRFYFKWFALPFALSLIALGLTSEIDLAYRIIYAGVALMLCEVCWLVLHTASFALLP
jgi:Na+/melibiose symporter-like transporter